MAIPDVVPSVAELVGHVPWRWMLAGLLISEAYTGLGLTRRLLREVTVAIVRLDVAAVALMRRVRPPRYALVGACQRRGACCTQIVADPPRAVKARPALVALMAGMHRLLHNFRLVGRGPDGQLVFRCGYLQTDGRCGIYRLRPRLCRTYPLLPWFAPPRLLPGCGYRVVLRGLQHSPRLPIVEPHVAVHHPTPVRRPHDTALEHAEDFVLVAGADALADPTPEGHVCSPGRAIAAHAAPGAQNAPNGGLGAGSGG